MPPRYAYWTIIVDNQPTAFRSGTQEELMPTFKRLKAKNDSAVMMWWQNGKLWPSRVDAQEMMRARGEMGRRGDERQAGSRFGDRERKPARERTAWTPRGEPSTPAPARSADDKLDWKPKGEFVPAPKRADRTDWKSKDSLDDRKPAWKPKGAFDREKKGDWSPRASRPQDLKTSRGDKPEWKPKGSFDRESKPDGPRSFKRPDFKPSGDDSRSAKPEWKPKGSFVPAAKRSEKPDWKPKGSFDRERKSDWKPKPPFDREGRSDWKPKGDWKSKTSRPQDLKTSRSEKPEWKPKGSFAPAPRRSEGSAWKPKSQDPGPGTSEKRKWVPKEEYKKSMGIEAKRDSKWRPGGEHKDPRQKYKDAKKAKWSKFKQNIRARSGGKGKKQS